ncbi:unnamed protein product, partial [Brenthis ino]
MTGVQAFVLITQMNLITSSVLLIGFGKSFTTGRLTDINLLLGLCRNLKFYRTCWEDRNWEFQFQGYKASCMAGDDPLPIF